LELSSLNEPDFPYADWVEEQLIAIDMAYRGASKIDEFLNSDTSNGRSKVFGMFS
jgi:hypothetical protein